MLYTMKYLLLYSPFHPPSTMNGLFTYDNISFASSRPSSIKTFSISTSNDTVYGIGSVSGRLLHAVGGAALRGVEVLAIRRKLRHINDIFPHTDNISVDNIEVLYDDALELSRYAYICRQSFIHTDRAMHQEDLAYIVLRYVSKQCGHCLLRLPFVRLATLSRPL